MKQCKAQVVKWRGSHQCGRKVLVGDLCIMHQPDAVARRNVESAERLVAHVRTTLPRLGAAEAGAREQLLQVLAEGKLS